MTTSSTVPDSSGRPPRGHPTHPTRPTAAAGRPETGLATASGPDRLADPVGFAALWLVRGTLATGWPARLPAALVLLAAALAVGTWGESRTRGLAPRPPGPAARQIERAVTIATLVQLAASVGLPVLLAAVGRPDLTVGTISVTIGILLLWLRSTLATAGHLITGILLVVVPVGLAAALNGTSLTAATGLATGAILLGSAVVGIRSLHPTGTPLRPDDPKPHRTTR